MARRIQLVDDLDGSDASETVLFGLDGQNYEIDLNESNAGQLRAQLSQWVEHARKTTDRKNTTSRGSKDSTAAKIRKWAQENNIPVNERGRVSAEVREAYRNAHNLNS